MRRIAVLVALLLPLLLVSPSGAPARLVTERFPFRTGSWIHVGMRLGDVVIEDVKFHEPVKFGGLIIRHDKPNRASVVVRNTGGERLDVGVAIAVFLEDDTLVGAANSGPTLGVLQPGERHEFDLAFHSVFRDMDRAATFVITAEY